MLACASLGAVLALALTAAGSPSRCATVLLAAQSSDPTAPAIDTAASNDVVRRQLQTVAEVTTTAPVLEQARFRLPAGTDAEAAQRSLTTDTPSGTGLLELSSCRTSSVEAAAIANAFADALGETLVAVDRDRVGRAAEGISRRLDEIADEESPERRALERRLAEYVVRAESASPGIRVVAGASPERVREQRPWIRNAAIGGALGLLVGAAIIAFARFVRDRRERESLLERAHGSAPLATVPRHAALKHPLADALPPDVTGAGSRLAERVLASGEGLRCVAIAGPQRFEGRSTVALLLARALAAAGQRPLLVEADLAHPALADRTGRADAPGLADIASGAIADADETVVTWAPSNRDRKRVAPENGAPAAPPVTIDLLHAGARVDRPEYLLDAPAVADFLRRARSSWDIVLLDLPAGRIPAGLHAHVDAVLLVNRPGVTDPERAARYRAMTEQRGGVPLLGYVLDGVRGASSA
jgi:Mrp family chromosome partitioning ATPase